MAEQHGGTIESVRGRTDGEAGEEILALWRSSGVLEGEAAQRRLREVVCVLRDAEGRVAGVNSVYPENVELIGGRRFWIYRSFIPPPHADAGPAMFKAAFDALDALFDPEDAGAPIGLCLAIADRTEMKRRPEAEWQDPRTLYAGYTADGRQVRIAYFAGAKI